MEKINGVLYQRIDEEQEKKKLSEIIKFLEEKILEIQTELDLRKVELQELNSLSSEEAKL